jgi:bzd-type benzoyl-CoA reductase Q subunit
MHLEKEYWKWPEYRRTVPGLNPTASSIVYAYSILRTTSGGAESAEKALAWALEETTMAQDAIKYIVATGYGRVNVDFANRALTEISCHARGANWIWGPTVRTIVDMGGQDCKAIRCDEKGLVTSFVMNDKCAAGTGRSIEVFADLLQVPIEELGKLSLQVENEPEALNSACVVFEKSEVVSRLQAGWSRKNLLAAICMATTRRVVQLLRRVGVERDLVVTGGIAKNIGVVSRLERELGVKSLPAHSECDPQLAGAMGAALFAVDAMKKSAAH